MGTRVPRRSLHRLLVRLGLHRHRVEPDLSALLAFPACRCGALLWPTPVGRTEPPSWSRPAPGRSLRRSSRHS